MKIYQFKSALAEKGDKARLHCGVIAQEVIKVFKEEGLDPFRYSMVCHDVWYETMIDGETITSQTPKDGYKRKEQYSIRYEEMLGFIIATL